jgi:hypothetical protein
LCNRLTNLPIHGVSKSSAGKGPDRYRLLSWISNAQAPDLVKEPYRESVSDRLFNNDALGAQYSTTPYSESDYALPKSQRHPDLRREVQ